MGWLRKSFIRALLTTSQPAYQVGYQHNHHKAGQGSSYCYGHNLVLTGICSASKACKHTQPWTHLIIPSKRMGLQRLLNKNVLTVSQFTGGIVLEAESLHRKAH